MNSVHITAEIGSASFYRTAVNGPTMSGKYTMAKASLYKSKDFFGTDKRSDFVFGFTAGTESQAGRFLSLI